jgi:hypothetical protein
MIHRRERRVKEKETGQKNKIIKIRARNNPLKETVSGQAFDPQRKRRGQRIATLKGINKSTGNRSSFRRKGRASSSGRFP